MPTAYPCPQCGKATVYNPKNAWRPFCSEQCKLLDLGAWASERHKIAGQALGDAEESQGEDWATQALGDHDD